MEVNGGDQARQDDAVTRYIHRTGGPNPED